MKWFSGQSEREREEDRFGATYREMADGELMGLQRTRGDLTEVAEAALASEMKRRGLEALTVEDSGPGVEALETDGAAGWKALHVFSQTFEAQAVFKLLEREGIEFAVEDRTVDERGQTRAGPAVQLALLVRGEDWNRAVALLRRKAGLFPEAVVDPRGHDEGVGEETVMVGEFEDAKDVQAATRVLEEAGVWSRTVTHEGEEWERTSIEVKAEDGDRALEALEKLMEEGPA